MPLAVLGTYLYQNIFVIWNSNLAEYSVFLLVKNQKESPTQRKDHPEIKRRLPFADGRILIPAGPTTGLRTPELFLWRLGVGGGGDVQSCSGSPPTWPRPPLTGWAPPLGAPAPGVRRPCAPNSLENLDPAFAGAAAWWIPYTAPRTRSFGCWWHQAFPEQWMNASLPPHPSRNSDECSCS